MSWMRKDRRAARNRTKRIIVVIVVTVAALLVARAIVKRFWLDCYYIPSGAMAPTLQPGDHVLVNKVTYRRQRPKRGDLVVFYSPDPDVAAHKLFIKRVVAVGGDRVLIANGKLYVNDMDQAVSEPYLKEPMHYQFPADGSPYPVPEGHLFVLGDNRNDSNDSHLFGPVAEQKVVGKVIEMCFPQHSDDTL